MLIIIYFSLALLLPFVLFFQFAWNYRRGFESAAAPEMLPKVAVILSLRGADPHLKDCLHGLLNQDYPDYSIFVVVDSPEDPAARVVAGTLRTAQVSTAHVRVNFLASRSEYCSLKLSAQRQAISELSDDFELIVFVDADTIAQSDWLRLLVAPFSNQQVGCSSGWRWFVPVDRSVASFARHMFHVGSCGFLYALRIPWGGSMAIRRRVLRESTLLSFWSRCFCEDVSAYRGLRDLDLGVEFASAATQFNSEPTSLKGTYQFIHRQHMCLRLHCPFWPIIAIGLLIYTLSFWSDVALLFLGFATLNSYWLIEAGIPMLILVFVAFAALLHGERLVRQRRRPPPRAPLGWRLVPAFFVLQAMLGYSLASALVARTVEWRGINYRVEGRDRIRMLNYSPYRSEEDRLSEARSI